MVGLSLDFPSFKPALNPAERARATDLYVTENMRLRGHSSWVAAASLVLLLVLVACMLDNQLLHFCVVGDISVIVHSSGVVASSSHLPTSASDSDQFEVRSVDLLHVDVSLDQWRAPVGRNILRNHISVNRQIPHIAAVATDCVRPWVGHGMVTIRVYLHVCHVLFVLLTDG